MNYNFRIKTYATLRRTCSWCSQRLFDLAYWFGDLEAKAQLSAINARRS